MKQEIFSSHRRVAGLKTQQGSVLIEVLVAILIFSFGVLGLVGLQGTMLRSQTDAKFRTDASFLASELIGLMEGDQANLAKYSIASGGSCGLTKCQDWLNKVKSGLPGGDATVTYTPDAVKKNGGMYDIVVSWTMPDGTKHRLTAKTSVFGNL